ncbi:hypothetical protein M0R04_06690 [Candidatus Dojkabacteria bacterium]|jgi:hypothetical protein|nr:hypothetical protein [Candidatus Dojkabacteria bacterium]
MAEDNISEKMKELISNYLNKPFKKGVDLSEIIKKVKERRLKKSSQNQEK